MAPLPRFRILRSGLKMKECVLLKGVVIMRFLKGLEMNNLKSNGPNGANAASPVDEDFVRGHRSARTMDRIWKNALRLT